MDDKPVVFTQMEIRIMHRQMKKLERSQETSGRAPLALEVKKTRSAVKKLERLMEMTS